MNDYLKTAKGNLIKVPSGGGGIGGKIYQTNNRSEITAHWFWDNNNNLPTGRKIYKRNTQSGGFLNSDATQVIPSFDYGRIFNMLRYIGVNLQASEEAAYADSPLWTQLDFNGLTNISSVVAYDAGDLMRDIKPVYEVDYGLIYALIGSDNQIGMMDVGDTLQSGVELATDWTILDSTNSFLDTQIALQFGLLYTNDIDPNVSLDITRWLLLLEDSNTHDATVLFSWGAWEDPVVDHLVEEYNAGNKITHGQYPIKMFTGLTSAWVVCKNLIYKVGNKAEDGVLKEINVNFNIEDAEFDGYYFYLLDDTGTLRIYDILGNETENYYDLNNNLTDGTVRNTPNKLVLVGERLLAFVSAKPVYSINNTIFQDTDVSTTIGINNTMSIFYRGFKEVVHYPMNLFFGEDGMGRILDAQAVDNKLIVLSSKAYHGLIVVDFDTSF